MVLGLIGLLVGTGLAWATRGTDRPRLTVTATNQGVLPNLTGVVLALSDGFDKVVLVDLDHRFAVRLPAQPQHGGVGGYRLIRTAQALIVGLDDVYAIPLNGGPTRPLGQATLSLPAVDQDRVWLVAYSADLHSMEVREVDQTGTVVQQRPGPDPRDGGPGVGLPGGIAFNTPTGIALWSIAQGRFTARLGSLSASTFDSHGNQFAWCEALCTALHLSRLGGHDLSVPAPTGSVQFEVAAGRYSPDGRLFAAVTDDRGGFGPNVQTGVVITNTSSGGSRLIRLPFTSTDPTVTLAWAPDGQRLYVTYKPQGSPDTTLVQIDPRTDELHNAVIPVPAQGTAIAIQRSSIVPLLQTPGGSIAHCQPATNSQQPQLPCDYHF
jgi:hypothetical protein